MTNRVQIQDILDFWFEELSPKQWWVKDTELDETIRTRFGTCHQQAIQGELWTWRTTSEGRLAEIIVLDQFSRNLFRNLPQAFSADAMALVLAQEAVSQGLHLTLPPKQQGFMLMPYMHSESLIVHEEAECLFSAPGLEGNLKSELQHKAILQRFGRYPHRNAVLGRPSTPE